MSIKQLKDDNGNPIGWGYEFDDGTLVETGYGRDGVVAAQGIANTTGGNINLASRSAEAQAAFAAAEAKAAKIAELDAAGLTDINGNVLDGETAYNLQQLADAAYITQTTGIASNVYEEIKARAGLDPESNDYLDGGAQALLSQYGIDTGSPSTDFWADSTIGGPQDVGAKAYYEAYQAAEDLGYLDSTEANLEEYAGKIDPNTGQAYQFIINDNVANAALIQDAMAETGQKSLASSTGFVVDKSTYDQKAAETYDWQRENVSAAYGATNTDSGFFNALQWKELAKKKKEEEDKVDQPVASITGGISDTTGGGQITGGGTPQTYSGPNFTSTPNIGTVTPVTSSGTYEVDLPTYEEGLNKQATEFAKRANDMKQFYQPQTQAEKEAVAASDPNYTAPAFENKLYRNRFGMTMYIQHINGVPSQPIPPGYYLVEDFTSQGQGVVGNNKGGVIQGFSNGATVNPAMNFKPGGTVVQEGNTYKIKYPDGSFSQGYDTAANAKAALDMGTANLGLPDYTSYLQQQGYNQSLPGYDSDAIYGAYQSYISDPATLAQIQADQAAANQPEVDPAKINQDFVSGEQEVTKDDLAQYQRNLAAQAYAAPGGAVAASPVSYLDPNAYGTVMESTAGQALGTAPTVTGDQVAQIGSATQAIGPGYEGLTTADYANMALEISTGIRDYDPRFDTNGDGTVTSADALAIAKGDFQVQQLESEKAYVQPEASTITANQAYTDVKSATDEMSASQLTGPTKTIDAAKQTGTSLAGMTSATGESVDVTGAPTRTEQTGEMITGTGVDQTKVGQAFGTGEVQAASVQGELANLMSQFEGGETPAWAAGSMRAATQMLAARGLGASSMAGQAVIQAAMEAALPIAQIDASNKQQVALFKAEQRAKFLGMEFDQAFQAKVQNAARVSEIANMNFTAEQQIALENSKTANTMELQNLTNEQALVMAEAAALSQMDMANLNNRQQAAIQNAQNFLQVDMANLANEQQTALFKQQSLVNTILSDQAASNAALQFNATSENQTNQFFANLAASVSQFNAAQQNAMKQFNADEVNSLLEFNANLQSQREMFNAQQYLVVAQANAQWRQNLATINTAAANESNMDYAQTVNGLTLKTLDEIWQRERDLMDYSFTSSENAADRALSILMGDKQLQSIREQLDAEEDQALGSLLTKVFFSSDFKSIFD